MATLDKNSMEKLMELNVKIAQEKDFSKKIVIISDAIKKIINAQRCSIFVHDKNSKSFWTVHADGISYLEIPDDKGIISKVFKSKEIIIDNNAQTSSHSIKNVDHRYVTKTILSMPILGFDKECIGVVQLLNKNNEDGFSDKDIKVLEFVINHFTTFIQLIVYDDS
ncbi:MAG: GAF domain-containing protein [Campylobacterota bacterium]|nr:GAF domain-containing protein [Campylobacterota bacterium]